MKKIKIILIVTIMVLSVSLFANGVLVVNSISQTLSDVYDMESGSVNPNVSSLGEVANSAPNKMAIFGSNVYVVITYENAVQKIDLFSKENRGMIYLESGALPNDIIIDSENHFAYVSGNGLGKVYKINLDTDEIVGSVDVGIAPQGMEIAGSKLFVANTGFNMSDYTYTDGTVSVIDLDTFTNVHTIATDINPTSIKKIGENIYVICTGNYANVMGYVDVFNYTNFQSISQISFDTAISGLAYDENNNRFFVGTPLGNGVYVCSANDNIIQHNANEGLFAGGTALCIAENYLAVVDPNNWTENSHIRFYNLSDFSLVSDAEAGVGATDVKFYTGTVDNDNVLIEASDFSNCYPNPFNISSYKVDMKIDYNGKDSQNIKYSVYNLKGQKIFESTIIGNKITWNGKDDNGFKVSSGVYYFKIIENDKTVIRKVTVLR